MILSLTPNPLFLNFISPPYTLTDEAVQRTAHTDRVKVKTCDRNVIWEYTTAGVLTQMQQL